MSKFDFTFDYSDEQESSTAPAIELSEAEQAALAQISANSPERKERELEERRLEFARWLFEQGRLKEEL